SGFRWKRSETSTIATSSFGSRNVVPAVGVTNTAQAAGLVTPELVVVDEIRQLLLDRRDVGTRGGRLAQLPGGLRGQVLQLDPLRIAARRRARRQVDRDARRLTSGQ